MRKLAYSLVRSIKKAVVSDTEVQKLIHRHPLLFRFLKNRLTPDETLGLHLTLGALIVGISGYIFFGRIYDLIGSDSILESDLTIINFLQLLRSPMLDQIMIFFAYLGSEQLVLFGTLASSIVTLFAKRWHYCLAFLISFGVSEIFLLAIQYLTPHSRPALLYTVIHEKYLSTPTGELFSLISFLGLLGYILHRSTQKRLVRGCVWLSTALILVAVGFSRIYLGMQWPADIAASFVCGIGWIAIIITVLEMRRKKRPSAEPRPSSPPLSYRLIALSYVFAFGWISLAWIFYWTHPIVPIVGFPENPRAIEREKIPQDLFVSLPRYSETLLGNKTEPINLIIIAEEAELRASFERAGWTHSDPISPTSLLKAGYASLFNTMYEHAPSAPTFWNARPNDFSYQKETEARSVRERHHIHFWRSPFRTNEGKQLWFSTAHFDKGIKLKSRFFVPGHTIDPAIDKERDRVLADLKTTGAVESSQKFEVVEPMLGKNNMGDLYFTDGNAYIIDLATTDVANLQ